MRDPDSNLTADSFRSHRKLHSYFLVAALLFSACDKAAPPRAPAAGEECPTCRQEDPAHAPRLAAEGATAELYQVAVGQSVVRGKPTAKLTLVVWSDFQCPFCKKTAATVDQLAREYGDELRVVFKHRPLGFHERALPAALAVEAAAEQGKFWEMHDRLFNDQQALGDAQLDALAAELGLSVSRFRAARSDARIKQRIADDQALADRLGVRGTPTLFINGRKITGARPLAALKPVLDEELQKATTLLHQGISRTALYDTLIKDGRTTAAPAEADSGTKPPEQDRTVYKIDTGRSPERGPKDAPITMVLYSDFQCPFCKRVESTVQALEKDFPGKLRVAWKNFPLPFHDKARGAARATLAAAEQGKFWAMHDKILENQHALERDNFESYARELELDLPRFRSAVDGPQLDNVIDEDLKSGQAVGVVGTPTIFINGRRVAGAQPLSTLRAIVQQELAKESRGG